MQWVLSGKVRPGGFVVHDPCQGNAAANDCGEGVDAAHRCAEGNTNQSLLRRIGEPESFLFGNHIEIVASIFPPHALHFVFIQAGNQRAVTVIMAGIIEYVTNLPIVFSSHTSNFRPPKELQPKQVE